MSGLDILYAILWFLAGVGVFIYGLRLLGDGLETLAGENIKKMFKKMDKNIFAGLGIGFATTAIVQSSSAVTVMTVGFVNSGFMSLLQATGIIFGANIGSTATAQLMAFGYGSITNINLTLFFAAFAGIGAFVSMAKNDLVKKIGSVLVGLGMLFVGLSIIGNSTQIFSESQKLVAFISSVKNPLLLLLAGIVITALIHSSGAISGITIALASVGILNFEQAMFLLVGADIGTCISAFIASIGANVNAKRVFLIHFVFNIAGAVLFVLTNLFLNYDKFFTSMFSSVETRVAMFHTFYNIATTLLLLPLAKVLVKFASVLLPDKPGKNGSEYRFSYIDYNFLETPSIAVQQTQREIENMLSLSMDNFHLAMESIMSCSSAKKDLFYKTEGQINFLNIEVTKFLSNLSTYALFKRDQAFIASSYHTLSDVERIGDHAVNIMEFADSASTACIFFSEESKEEMKEILHEIEKLYEYTLKVYSDGDLSFIPLVNKHEDQIDNLKKTMGQKHIERLEKGTCTPEAGAIYLSLASNCERVGDHLRNIAILAKNLPQKTPTEPLLDEKNIPA